MGKKTHEYPFRFKGYTALTKSLASQTDCALLELVPGGQISIKITRLRNADGQKNVLNLRGFVRDGKDAVEVKGVCDLTKKTGHLLLTKKLAEQVIETPEPLLKDE